MTPENEAKKQYLLRYRQAEREVRLLMEEKERLLALATKVTPSYSGETKGSGSGNRVESAAEKIIQCEEGRQELCQIGGRRCVHTISENERWRSAARGCGWASAPASFLDQRKRSGGGSGISAEDLTITYVLMRG
nr:MAG TPA: hypothetical protein [Caudoviricetes sp.]